MTDHITLPRSVLEQAMTASKDAAFDELGYTLDPDLAESYFNLRAALAGAAQAEPVACEGIRKDFDGEKCPITGRPYFMHLNHPELGTVPTYGGPFDSYTVPTLDGEPTNKWHEREMRCERYDHDAGSWVDGGHSVPLRIIHEDELLSLEDDTAPQPAQPVAVPQGWKLVQVELLEGIAPEEPINQDEMGGCVWCAGTPPGEKYGHAGANPDHHEKDCPWVRTRMILAAPTPPAATAPVLEPLTDAEIDEEWFYSDGAKLTNLQRARNFARAVEAAHAAKLANRGGV